MSVPYVSAIPPDGRRAGGAGESVFARAHFGYMLPDAPEGVKGLVRIFLSAAKGCRTDFFAFLAGQICRSLVSSYKLLNTNDF